MEAPNPHLLRTFLAVHQDLSFTRAAERLALTQPAVSRQIQQLEGQLSVTLFDRLGKSVYPTDEGRALVPLAEQLLAHLDRVVETVQEFAGAERGRLRIGASATPGYYLLPSVLGRFHRRYPRVELHFRVENTQAVEQLVLRNELDLGIVGAHPENPTLLMESVADDEIVCFCAPTHPLASRRRVSADRLGDVTWIVREPGSATRELFEEWLASHGSTMRNVIELNSPEAIKALVREGVGISFMSLRGLEPDLRARRLRRIAVSRLRLTRSMYLIRHPDKHVSPTIRAFLDVLPLARRAARPA